MATNAELEAAIRAQPDLADTYLVYADWLQQQGDPRGELIMIDHVLSTLGRVTGLSNLERPLYGIRWTPPGDEQLTSKLLLTEREMLSVHRKELVGELDDVAQSFLSASWRYAFIEQASLFTDLEQAVSLLSRSAAGRFTRDLELQADNEDEAIEAIDAFTDEHAAFLRSLAVNRADADVDPLPIFDLGALQRFTRLSSFSLSADTVENPALVAASALASFEIRTRTLRPFVELSWPNLQSFAVRFSERTTGAFGRVDQMFTPGRFPRLKKLALRRTDGTRHTFSALSRSKILPQLEELCLADGDLNDASAEAIADERGQLVRLKRLDVDYNRMTSRGRAVLEALGIEVSCVSRPDTIFHSDLMAGNDERDEDDIY